MFSFGEHTREPVNKNIGDHYMGSGIANSKKYANIRN